MESEKQNNAVNSTDSKKQQISEATKIKHKRSVQAFPELNLSPSEYVILCIMKHKIALVAPLGASVLALVLVLTAILNMDLTIRLLDNIGLEGALSTDLYHIFGWLIALILIVMYATYYVYTHNRFILTSENIIQETQRGLLMRNEQTVRLDNVEDASYYQRGLIQQMFNYGSLRLSTEGDETKYRFSYVYDPREKISILNNTIESFKNSRSIEG